MSDTELKLSKLDEHIPDYVLGRTDAKLSQRIEEKMRRDKRFEKQVHVEQALVASMSKEKSMPTQHAPNFSALEQRINEEGEVHTGNSLRTKRYLPAIAAGFLVAAIALPLLMQNSDQAGNEFEALSAPSSMPAQEQKMLRVIYSDGISERRRDEIASLYKLEVIETVGALNSIIYKLPNDTTNEELLLALQEEEFVEFAALTSAIK